jgi:hypothetical protein
MERMFGTSMRVHHRAESSLPALTPRPPLPMLGEGETHIPYADALFDEYLGELKREELL